MTRTRRLIIGGVDTHTATHHAAVIDLKGRLLDDAEFTASPAGYAQLLIWMRERGQLQSVGIEGTGAYGAGLARYLHEKGVTVLEVPRPERRLRRQHGKSDPLDAEAAARTVLAGNASGAPKPATGPIEAIRMLRVARTGAVKAKTAAANTLQAVLVTAPEPLRSQLRTLSTSKLIAACLRFRPDTDSLHDPVQAAKLSLRSIATRARALDAEARSLKRQLDALTAAAAPIPSSGKTHRHRLHRGGDRSGNRALHIAVVVRLRYHQRSRDYAARRTTEGLSMPEIIRCQKRYLAREVFTSLRADYAAITT